MAKEKDAKLSYKDMQVFLNKEFGLGTVQRLGSKQIADIPQVPMSSLTLQDLMGCLPKGRIIEIYGPESSGKTSLACYFMGQFQQAGLEVAFVDVEHALDVQYATTFGVNMNKVILGLFVHGKQQALGQVGTGIFGVSNFTYCEIQKICQSPIHQAGRNR